MAKLTPAGQKFYKPHFGLISWILVLSATIPLDILKFFLDLIPGVDLINIPLTIFAWCILNVFFFIHLGLSYLGGKKQGRKVFVTIATAILGLIPLLDGIDFDETLDAAGLMWVQTDEDVETANANAIGAQKANDNAQARGYQYAVYMQQRVEAEQEALRAANDNRPRAEASYAEAA